MTTTVFTKKIKLYPLGDKTEVNRVYTYLRDAIVIENITKDVLVEHPVLLRNWSFYQLIEFIKYKAKVLEIPVIIGEKTKTNLCHNCGEELSIENILTSEETEWSKIIECNCSGCKKKYNYAYNKAKLLAKNE